MGGRRATSLGEIVGGGLGPQKASFTRSIGDKDPERIAESSAKLAAGSERVSDILFYAAKLADFVRKHASEDLGYEERIHLAREEWSRVKKRDGIENDPIVTKAIVSAATKALGRGKKS
jgi:hypothetical protein